jgi:hypothetical protein
MISQHYWIAMDDRHKEPVARHSSEDEKALDHTLDPRSSERQSFLELTREMARLPLEQSAAALETSAAIAGVSLRAGIEFLRAAPEAAKLIGPTELRSWGEMGRRLAMSDVETAITFFKTGVHDLEGLDAESRSILFQLCLRQMSLANSVAYETFRSVPALASKFIDPNLILPVLEIASEIARRSARHSAEFLNVSPVVAEVLQTFDDPQVTQKALSLAAAFATRTGGIASDAWAALPTALAKLESVRAQQLIERTVEFLERGGGAALHLMLSGGEILRSLPEIFDDWIELLWTIATHGNASLVAFVRSSPGFFQVIAADAERSRSIQLSKRVLSLTKEIGKLDGEAALACFRSSTRALRTVSIEQFEEWARQGLSLANRDVARSRRSYFALETRGSYEALHSGSSGLALDTIQHLLRLYVEALTGREVDIAPLAAVPQESRIGDGRTIHLPSQVNEFGDAELDFRLYKVLAAHASGQIEFGTYERDTNGLAAAYLMISAAFDPENADLRDSFSLNGYLNIAEPTKKNRSFPSGGNYASVLSLFPDSRLARRVFGTLENGRIDRRLRSKYRGLTRDLDLIREHLRRRRPEISKLPAPMVPFELLFQITMLGGALDDSRQAYQQIVSELESIVVDYLQSDAAGVADTLVATGRVYSLFQSVVPTTDSLQQIEVPEEGSDNDDENAPTVENMRQQHADRTPRRRDARELFNAWNEPNADGEPDQLDGAEAWIENEMPEQILAEGEVAFNYDEWDRELTDHRLGWCRVVEKQVRQGDRSFVDQTRERHKGAISSIRHQFQLMRPENLIRIANELDGEDYDLNAVIDYVIDRRADGQQSERLYTKRLRRRRDVAVSFLLDQSSSTARTIGRHPLQPYTRPGRRIIEIEKEGLVLMSEALEAVGDIYSINGFTSEGRRNVKFYVVKDFGEKYTDEVKRRIGGITYQNNTRLGAAIRHATARLSRQDARTRLLIVLSDGRPYDHDYGDARYAREDTREALRQAKNAGITPFCITIDRESEAELRDLYGEIGYTIIDDVLSLPERMPGIYRRLTT